jgi:hypothetical protein
MSTRRLAGGWLYPRYNAGIATNCGAWISQDYFPLINLFAQSNQQWVITGITKDSTGAALGNCRVVAFETGRIAKDGAPVVGETISDGSGNYSIPVPLNTIYHLVGYLPGSPDVAGSTVNKVTPTANG